MDTRPDHVASMREIARGVARELERIVAGDQVAQPLGLSSFFRVRGQWRAHGWYGRPEMDRLKDLCSRVFANDDEDPRAFVRGMRSAARIEVEDSADGPATINDRDVFWACIAALGAETGIAMPDRPVEFRGPVLRGH